MPMVTNSPVDTNHRSGAHLFLRTGVTVLPHPDKVEYGGEDAYFISTNRGGSIGVADGVGGWRKRGVNPAIYSRLFMHNCCCHLEGRLDSLLETPGDSWKNSSASSILKHVQEEQYCNPIAAMMVAHTITHVPGSATACVMELDPDLGVLTAGNLGDSGFVVLREGKPVLHSEPLQHHFDCPLQFGHPAFGTLTDWADNANVYTLELKAGDVVITGSDGLWDNVFLEELLQLLPRAAAEVHASAAAMADLAAAHGSDPTWNSPYSIEATRVGQSPTLWWNRVLQSCFSSRKGHKQRVIGGKLDDVTVLVSFVEEKAWPQQHQQVGQPMEPSVQLELLDEPWVMDCKDSFTSGTRSPPGWWGEEDKAGKEGLEHWSISVADEPGVLAAGEDQATLRVNLLPRIRVKGIPSGASGSSAVAGAAETAAMVSGATTSAAASTSRVLSDPLTPLPPGSRTLLH